MGGEGEVEGEPFLLPPKREEDEAARDRREGEREDEEEDDGEGGERVPRPFCAVVVDGSQRGGGGRVRRIKQKARKQAASLSSTRGKKEREKEDTDTRSENSVDGSEPASSSNEAGVPLHEEEGQKKNRKRKTRMRGALPPVRASRNRSAAKARAEAAEKDKKANGADLESATQCGTTVESPVVIEAEGDHPKKGRGRNTRQKSNRQRGGPRPPPSASAIPGYSQPSETMTTPGIGCPGQSEKGMQFFDFLDNAGVQKSKERRKVVKQSIREEVIPGQISSQSSAGRKNGSELAAKPVRSRSRADKRRRRKASKSDESSEANLEEALLQIGISNRTTYTLASRDAGMLHFLAKPNTPVLVEIQDVPPPRERAPGDEALALENTLSPSTKRKSQMECLQKFSKQPGEGSNEESTKQNMGEVDACGDQAVHRIGSKECRKRQGKKSGLSPLGKDDPMGSDLVVALGSGRKPRRKPTTMSLPADTTLARSLLFESSNGCEQRQSTTPSRRTKKKFYPETEASVKNTNSNAEADGMGSQMDFDRMRTFTGALESSENTKELTDKLVEAIGACADWLRHFKILGDWRSYCPYAKFSAKLQHVFEEEVSDMERLQGVSLPLFGSLSVADLRLKCSQDVRPLENICNDFVLHVGGPVWSLDWCPRRPGWLMKDREFLAVGVHPCMSPYHKLGEPLSGKGLIQIWAFNLVKFSHPSNSSETWKNSQNFKCMKNNIKSEPGVVGDVSNATCTSMQDSQNIGQGTEADGFKKSQDLNSQGNSSEVGGAKRLIDTTFCNSESSSVKMVLGLAHEGEVTWDLKWQPVDLSDVSREQDKREIIRLGYLAAILGDGSIQVFDVPMPQIFEYHEAEGNTFSKSDPLVLNNEPLFKCSGISCGGHKSIPLTIEWSTWAPHDLILAGFHDGVVALWKFSPLTTRNQDAKPLMTFVADSGAIRSIAWAPDGSGVEGRNLVATAGHSGILRFWDLRDPFLPTWDLHLYKGYILKITWLLNPSCLVVSMDDGSLRTVSVNMAGCDTPATGKECTKTPAFGVQTYACSRHSLWDVQVSESTGLLAYGGENGSVVQFQLTLNAVEKEKSRYRKPNFLCGMFSEDSDSPGLLFLISQRIPTPLKMEKSDTEFSKVPVSRRKSTELAAVVADGNSNSKSLYNLLKLHNKRTNGANVSREAAKLDPSQVHTGSALVPFQDENEAWGKQCKKKYAEEGLGNQPCTSLALVPTNVEDKSTHCGSEIVSYHSTNTNDTPRALDWPSKMAGVHRVRWNPNTGMQYWLCYGGGAGILRCHQIFPQGK